MNKINKNEVMYLIKPMLILVTLIILVILLVVIGMKQITTVITKINESKQAELLLNQKITVLEKVTTVISGDTTFFDFVIPSKTSVLYGLSQIKSQASKNSLLISTIKTGSMIPEKNGISKNAITFEIEGSESSVYTFLTSLSKMLPLMNVDKVKINKSL